MNYNELLNPGVVSVKPSGIRKFFSIAEEMDDVISLGVGEPDFLTPWHIRQLGINSLEKGFTRYTANAGLIQLRKEISDFYKRKYNVSYAHKTEVLVTVGGSEGIDMCIRSVVCPGDEVLVVEPSFVCYKPIVETSGGVAVPLVTRNENKFKLTAEEIENAVTDKTKLLILPFPNNPTGAVMRKEDLEKIAEVIIKHNLFVLSDEIYSELTYGDQGHTSIASIDGMKERTVVINGFSKTYSMTGWRLGYALGPEPVIAQMTKLHQFAIMSAPTTSQYAAIDALKNGDNDIKKMRDDYDMRRRFTVNAFRSIGLDCFEPEGAFYLFPCIKSTGLTSEEFCEKLIYSKKVAVVPGNAFGDCGEGFIRVSYCYSIDNIKEAVRRIEEFINELGESNGN
ncbi:MAG: aminotransferase class I/II-fold pyridoxal phosphate-dependent enzyme [Acetobacter sp.]|nr:aminotransferase class I/II-fold pyridoxal phosphate-dependent enzyme [Bacteroides sp.]MCM1341462.1 aminotransferase class I/II-fold pyridoxal phosphate-dependent enzyme [Acetobacter sp.]MCM1433414.1 aminotransferase class I/II-fold pyridoxal phosphate-dependent enzyme [Clostridiales bacterium]